MPVSKDRLAKSVSRKMENSVAAPLRALGEDAAYMATVGVERREIHGMYSAGLTPLLYNLMVLYPIIEHAGPEVSEEFEYLMEAIVTAIYSLGEAYGTLRAGGDPRDAMADVSVTLEGV